jgi:hypothetical protein
MTSDTHRDPALPDAVPDDFGATLLRLGLRFAATAAGRVVRFVFRILVLISALGVAITIYDGTGLWWPAAISAVVIVAGWVWLGRRWSARTVGWVGSSIADGDAS